MLKEMNSSDVIKFYNELKNNKDLHLEMPQIGCFARTDIICKKLIEEGYDAKIVRTNLSNSVKGKLFFQKDNETKVSKQEVNWSFHVAAAVNVDGEILVLDPAMISGPEKISFWASAMSQNNRPLSETNVTIEDYATKGKSFIANVYQAVSSKDDKEFFAKTKNIYEGYKFVAKPSMWLRTQISKDISKKAAYSLAR